MLLPNVFQCLQIFHVWNNIAVSNIQKVSNYFSTHLYRLYQFDFYSDYLLPPIAFVKVPTVRDLVEEVMLEVMSKDLCYFASAT